MQYPFFKRGGLSFQGMHAGTINISIAPKEFCILRADYTFYNIKWRSNHPVENFSFVRCFIVFGNNRYPGFIYFPHPETKQGVFSGFSLIEVLTRFIPGISYGQKISCVFSSAQIKIF